MSLVKYSNYTIVHNETFKSTQDPIYINESIVIRGRVLKLTQSYANYLLSG